MPDLFGLDIAGIINTEIANAGGVLTLTLTQYARGARGPNPTGGRDRVPTDYSCQGFIDKYQSSLEGETLVQLNVREVLILGASLPEGIIPTQGDEVVVEGTRYIISTIPERDPAAATYICKVS